MMLYLFCQFWSRQFLNKETCAYVSFESTLTMRNSLSQLSCLFSFICYPQVDYISKIPINSSAREGPLLELLGLELQAHIIGWMARLTPRQPQNVENSASF